MSEKRIVIIEDEESLVESLGMYLSERGYRVQSASSGKEGIEICERFSPHVILLDVKLPDMDGLEVLKELKKRERESAIIIMTAYHDMDVTIKAVKYGAFDYLIKPLDINEIEKTLKNAIRFFGHSHRKTGSESENLTYAEGKIIGKTPAIKEILKMIGILSETRVTVLIEGETGTGKELIARAIHCYGPFRNEPFVAINCASIVPTLLESELFGYEKGAFTGAIKTKRGKFEIAGKGTIFLDEISDLPFELQGKLLRFLQEKEFERVGGERPIRSDARVIAASNQDLLIKVKKGEFREDLYYRLSAVKIKVPPLRERLSDLPILADYLLKRIATSIGKEIKGIDEKAIGIMRQYSWPGNVRELENVLLQAAINAKGKIIKEEDVSSILEDRKRNLSDQIEDEKKKLLEVLNGTRWHLGKASSLLGVSRPTLRKRMREAGIFKK